ncbi:MAG: transcription termination/antitermination protein NusG [Acidobacteria bacterium]|nr:transcription termination/antitermination protein NusG [Acidobacteriota bacterium]
MSENEQLEPTGQDVPVDDAVATDVLSAEALEEVSTEPESAGVAGDVVSESENVSEEPAVEESAADEPAIADAVAVENAEEAAEPETVEAAPDESEDEDAAPSAGVPGMDWYIIHTYSGFENKVRESLQTRGDAFGLGDKIGEILIPTEDVVEMRNGKKATSKRLLYPGYVLIQLKMDDELWHVVKNTPRVTSFVGSGQTPTPLSADEVNQILYRQTTSAEKPRPKMSFERNDRVKIVDGPFSNFTGTIEDVNQDRSTLKVMVTIFGRGTPVELEYFQVEKEKL